MKTTFLKQGLVLVAALGTLTFTNTAQARQVGSCNLVPNTQCAGADLQNADLKNVDLRNANLSGANLIGANLSGANLNHANFKNAVFHRATMQKTHVVGTDLSYADLSFVSAQESNFESASLHHASLTGSQFNNVNFSHANLQKTSAHSVNFAFARFYRAHLSDADATGASFHGANLHDASFHRTILEHADFTAHFQNTDLTHAKAHTAKRYPSNFNSDSKAVDGLFIYVRAHVNGYPRTSYNLPGGGCYRTSPNKLNGNHQEAADVTVDSGYCYGSVEAGGSSFFDVNQYMGKKFLTWKWDNNPDGKRPFTIQTENMSHNITISGNAPGNGGELYVHHVSGLPVRQTTGHHPHGTPGGPIRVYLGSSRYMSGGVNMRGYVLGLTGYLEKTY